MEQFKWGEDSSEYKNFNHGWTLMNTDKKRKFQVFSFQKVPDLSADFTDYAEGRP
jgi:hypothetical protein